MSAPPKEVYVLDTSFLIDLALWLPIPLHSKFWIFLVDSLKRKEWILLSNVVAEIRSRGDLKAWCETQQRNGLTVPIETKHKDRGIEINNLYPMIDLSTGKSENDTYILAFAGIEKKTVVSRERWKDTIEPLYKIPDVCAALKIPIIRDPRAFMNGINYKN